MGGGDCVVGDVCIRGGYVPAEAAGEGVGFIGIYAAVVP